MNDAERLELPHVIPEGTLQSEDEINEHGYYDRSGNNISFRDWARLGAWDNKNNNKYRRVAQDTVGDYWVSTVWIGLNHSFRPGLPLIFETMVFNKSLPEPPGLSEVISGEAEYPENTSWSDLDSERYSTEEEALEGHKRMVEKVRLIVEATKEIE